MGLLMKKPALSHLKHKSYVHALLAPKVFSLQHMLKFEALAGFVLIEQSSLCLAIKYKSFLA